MANFYASYPFEGGGGGSPGVTSLNGEIGDITLIGGTGISITPAGQNITIANTQTAFTPGDLTDAGTDGITITGGTGAVNGSGTSISQHVSDATHNGYLSSVDWNTFNSKQASGNYITALTGDVTASGPGSVASTLANTPHKVYVDFVLGNDSTGTGSLVRPWQSLQHAYNSITPTINEPYAIYLLGGNNDPDASLITAKPNVSIVSDYLIQVAPGGFTISGGTTNDGCTFTNLIFVGAFTWIRSDNSVISLGFNNIEFFSGPTFQQNGAGSATVSGINSVFVNSVWNLPNFGSFFFGCSFLGTSTFGDQTSAAYYEFVGGYNDGAMSFSGGIQVYFQGFIQDTPFGAATTFVTTGNGTPIVQIDSAGLPATYTGTPSLIYQSFSQYESYTPSDSSKWANPQPTNVKQALDRIAAVVGLTIPIP